MKNLSVREFKDLCSSLSPQQFIFSTENQSWNDTKYSVKMKKTFTRMLVALSPNAICFKNQDDYMCFDRVKFVKVCKEKSILGMIFTIVCGELNNNSNDISYTLIAR